MTSVQHIQDVETQLRLIHEKVLEPKGIASSVSKLKNFPFPDYASTIAALRDNKAKLSFGLPSGTAFSAVATEAERNAHSLALAMFWIAAPLALVTGSVLSGNYYLLLFGLLWFPLSIFGTQPTYKAAPPILMLCVVLSAIGLINESAWLLNLSVFTFLTIGGNSLTRRIYNKTLIKRAMTIEAAFIFLLAGNYLNLCAPNWSLLWEPDSSQLNVRGG